MQRRTLPVISGDRALGILSPVKFALTPSLENLWGLLHEHAPFFVGDALAGDRAQMVWHLMQQIIDLHPGAFDLSPAIDDLPLLQALFFEEPRILWLNEYQECEASKKPRPYRNQNQPAWYKELKTDSCGDYWLDRMADLEAVFGSMAEARAIAELLTPSELEHYLYRKGENAIPLEQMAEEHKIAHFEERMKNDPDAQKWLAESLGVGDYDDDYDN